MTTWDPDGPGPLAPVLVVAGQFTLAGDVLTHNIATWNPTTRQWSALGAGIGSQVEPVVPLPNGDLLAGNLNRIARWNGSTWSTLGTLGTTIDDFVRAIVVLPNGDVVAGGDFTTANGQSANHVARWNGAAWSPLGPGLTYPVHTLVVMPNGELIAAVVDPGGVTTGLVWRWDGTTWSTLGDGLSGHGVYALAVLPNGDLVASNDSGIQRWNGASWAAFGSGGNEGGGLLAVLPGGDLVATGAFPGFIARWNGSAWSPLGSGLNQSPSSLAMLPSGEIAVGLEGAGVRIWNGTSWSVPGTGIQGEVFTLASLPGGDFVAATVVPVGAPPGTTLARWSAGAWSAFGGTIHGVNALGVFPDGDIVAGGSFIDAGGVAANRIARWDGIGWSPLGTGLTGPSPPDYATVFTIAALPNDQLVAGGSFSTAGGVSAANIARWDGSAWSLSAPGSTAPSRRSRSCPTATSWPGAHSPPLGARPRITSRGGTARHGARSDRGSAGMCTRWSSCPTAT